MLRGEESDGDEQFVRDLADRFGIPFVHERMDAAAEVDRAGGNLEQTARDLRRSFFRRLMQDGAVDRVALGHTRSDQAETVLFRLLRGAYTAGLAGMRPVTDDGLVRPLLNISRRDVEDYLRTRNLGWREDSSNRDLRFARNRIRHELLPQLTEAWNPQLPDLLASHGQLAREDEEYWGSIVAAAEPSLLSVAHDGAILLDLGQFGPLPDALGRRIIRRAIERLRGNLRSIDFQHIQAILGIARGPVGHSRVQAPGVDVLRSCDWVRFAKPREGPTVRDYEVPLEVPGRANVPRTGLRLCLELIESQPGNPRDTLKTGLDWERIQPLLILRNWRPGDAYLRLGAHRPEKLKHLFQEARIPLWERATWPVLTSGGRIVWSRTFGPAQEFAADSSTKAVLTITEQW